MNLKVRTMDRNEVGIVLKWAEIEGWNPGLNDAECFHVTDPNGFFIGEIGGEPVGSISVVKYGDDFGFLGLYIVRPEFRGKGYGLRIWKEGIAYLESRNIGLDGVVAQQANYMQSGFRLAYRNIRYQGMGGVRPCTGPGEIVGLSSLSTPNISEYDRGFFPAPREKFLECWVRQRGGRAIAALSGGSRISGYSVMRPCHRGFKIGPLFADSPEIAGQLFSALCESVPGEPVFLDVPEPNRQAIFLAERNGMEKVFETARMYTKAAPSISLDRTYGVTTFELG